MIGRSGGSALVHVCSVVAAGSHVCVSSFNSLLPFFSPPLPAVLLFPQYLFISLAHRDVWKGRDVGREVEKKA